MDFGETQLSPQQTSGADLQKQKWWRLRREADLASKPALLPGAEGLGQEVSPSPPVSSSARGDNRLIAPGAHVRVRQGHDYKAPRPPSGTLQSSAGQLPPFLPSLEMSALGILLSACRRG